MQRHWPPFSLFSTVAVLLMTAVSASAAGNADEKALTRYLGSPSGEYKLTVETTGDTTRATLKRLIIPNETLWHKDLSYLSAGHAGFIGDNGTVVLLNLRDGRVASSAVRIFRSDGSLLEEYTVEDIAQTLKNSSPEHADVKPDQISTSGPPHLKYGRIEVPIGSAALLIDLDTGALTMRLEKQ